MLLGEYFMKKIAHPNIVFYKYDGFIHSKLLVVDKKIILTGSNNLDYRSLNINFENCLIIESMKFALECDKYCDAVIAQSTLITKTMLKKKLTLFQSLWIKFVLIGFSLL
jgi:cardiolipin synthase